MLQYNLIQMLRVLDGRLNLLFLVVPMKALSDVAVLFTETNTLFNTLSKFCHDDVFLFKFEKTLIFKALCCIIIYRYEMYFKEAVKWIIP